MNKPSSDEALKSESEEEEAAGALITQAKKPATMVSPAEASQAKAASKLEAKSKRRSWKKPQVRFLSTHTFGLRFYFVAVLISLFFFFFFAVVEHAKASTVCIQSVFQTAAAVDAWGRG
jgi:hypothetical protein